MTGLSSLFLLAGCRSDPYCDNAIANLRAEKIQLENEYYALKSRYESDMARLGQPVESGGYPGSSPGFPEYHPGYIGEEILGSEIVYPTQVESVSTRSVSQSGIPAATDNSTRSMAGYIRSIELHQLASRQGGELQLLVQPLDDVQAVMPLAGDLKVRVRDRGNQSTLFEREYTAAEVVNMVTDQPGARPGIHLPIRLAGPFPASGVICDLQYRTADNRVLRQSINCSATTNVSSPVQSQSAQPQVRTPRTPVESLAPDDLGGQVRIEFGDELNFESLESPSGTQQRPAWGPDR